jgi:hypothetical protein
MQQELVPLPPQFGLLAHMQQGDCYMHFHTELEVELVLSQIDLLFISRISYAHS